MIITEMQVVTETIAAAFQRMIPQLTEHSVPPDWAALEQMAASPDTVVLLAWEPNERGEIVGSATLAIAHSPTGAHGWIEDVIVEEQSRGRGTGRALVLALLEKAGELDLDQVYLTSRPSRVAANKLYQSLSFVLRETNVYRFVLKE